MNAEAQAWVRYAWENMQAASVCLDHELLNPCLHNAQQAVEKSLKAMCLIAGVPLRKTHSIGALCAELEVVGVKVGLSEDDCDLLDSIYLPSKYPLGSALPDFHPDEKITRRCLECARRTIADAEERIAAD